MNVYWLGQTEADLPGGPSQAADPLRSEHFDWLSPSEIGHLNSLRFPKRRADWQLGRWTAKNAVARYLHLPAQLSALADLEIRAASDGAPEAFLKGEPASVVISLSHRAGVAVCAVAPPGTALGCDVEAVEPRSAAFVADYFTCDERELIEQAPQSERFELVTLLWSAKESALKALRAGLRLDTRCVTVTPARTGGGWHPVHVCQNGGRVFHGWWKANDGIVQTLVADPAPSAPLCLP